VGLINSGSRNVCSIAGIRIVRTACRTFLPVVVDGSGGSHRTGNHAIRTSVLHIMLHRNFTRNCGSSGYSRKFSISGRGTSKNQFTVNSQITVKVQHVFDAQRPVVHHVNVLSIQRNVNGGQTVNDIYIVRSGGSTTRVERQPSVVQINETF